MTVIWVKTPNEKLLAIEDGKHTSWNGVLTNKSSNKLLNFLLKELEGTTEGWNGAEIIIETNKPVDDNDLTDIIVGIAPELKIIGGNHDDQPRCPICGKFLTATQPGWHGTVGSDLAGTGTEYYCKKGERDGTH